MKLGVNLHGISLNTLLRIEADVKPGPERDAIVKFVKDHNYKIASLPLEMI